MSGFGKGHKIVIAHAIFLNVCAYSRSSRVVVLTT